VSDLVIVLAAAGAALVILGPVTTATTRRLGAADAGAGPPERRPTRRQWTPEDRSAKAEHASGRSVLAGAAATRAAAVMAGAAVALLLGGWPGLVLGATTTVVTERQLRRLEPTQVRRQREQRRAEAPLVLDLLAISLRSGMPVSGAAETVAGALPGALADDLRRAAALCRLGASPAAAWAELAGDSVLGPVARAIIRSSASGSRLAEVLERLAADLRAEAVTAAEAQARRAGVLAMAPLGLCFLPAFLCIGVVPVVLSIAATVVHG
jgi:Flp pilus assembly protein TadB